MRNNKRKLASINPVDSFTVFPAAFFGLAACGCVSTLAVLLSVFPGAFVLATIGPTKDPMPLFFVVDIFTIVGSTIRPLEVTRALHFVVFPLAYVNSLIAPVVDAVPLNIVVMEIALVSASISPGEQTFAVLLTILV
jgi:hypothetical protein